MFIVPVSRSGRNVDRLFDDAFEQLFRVAPATPVAPVETAATPSLDVSESERGWTATLDMPGVAKEDVQISVEGRRVNVQAAAKPAEAPKDGDRIVWRERSPSPSRYARSFVLPVEVEQADTQARLENGVLTLVLPKRADKAASQITVS